MKVNDIYNTDDTNLKRAFYDACSNKEFKKYIDSLNISEDILVKYTSFLEQSYNEIKNCSKCNNLESCLNEVKGYCYKGELENDIMNFSYYSCKYYDLYLKQNSYQKMIEVFELPKELKEASFKNIYKDDKNRLPIIKYFKEFIDNYTKGTYKKGMYLYGNFGSGKTYLIAALFNELAKKNIKSALIYYPEFLRNLKANFNTNYSDLFNHIKKIDLLLIDDVGAENCSNWSRDEVLGPILQYRMDSSLPTFFTSNLSIDELEENLSITNNGVDKVKAKRIIERIKQLTEVYELISKNRRI